jgi:hypothetical protein
VATIASATPQYVNEPVNFTASGSDADGVVVLYEWDWEDDGVFDYSSGVSANTVHTYSSLGSYRAKLRVTDDDGAIGLDVIDLTIIDPRVYVATTGSDANSGSSTQPVATLAQAYQIAQTNGMVEIYVQEGNYSQVPNFLPGISVYGGRTLPSWSEGVSHSVFNVGASRATASGIASATTIRRIWIQTSNQVGSANSIALYASSSGSGLRFEECRFVASGAGLGTAGTPGPSGTTGGSGSAGQNGSCDSGHGLGGAGGVSPAGCPGGAGGAGGAMGPNNGLPGAAGGCSGGTGGVPGNGCNGGCCSTCSGFPGGNGGSGSIGTTGVGGTAGTSN